MDGRWIGRDRITVLNLYDYIKNQLINNFDILGLENIYRYYDKDTNDSAFADSDKVAESMPNVFIIDGHGSPNGMYDSRTDSLVSAEQLVKDVYDKIDKNIDIILICGCRVGQNKQYNRYIHDELEKRLGRDISVYAATGDNTNYKVYSHKPDSRVGAFFKRVFGGIYTGNGLFGPRDIGSWGQRTEAGEGTPKNPQWVEFD